MSTDSSPHVGQSRAVLAVVISSRFSGFACLDGFGLSDGTRSFGSWCLRQRSSLLERAELLDLQLTRAIARLRPAVVVLAVRRGDGDLRRLLDAAIAACGRTFTRVVVSHADEGLRALGWRRSRSFGETVTMLVRHFVPELANALPFAKHAVHLTRSRYRRGAWQAASLAVRELARTRPWSVAALVRDRPPRCPLLDELASAVLTTHPDAV